MSVDYCPRTFYYKFALSRRNKVWRNFNCSDGPPVRRQSHTTAAAHLYCLRLHRLAASECIDGDASCISMMFNYLAICPRSHRRWVIAVRRLQQQNLWPTMNQVIILSTLLCPGEPQRTQQPQHWNIHVCSVIMSSTSNAYAYNQPILLSMNYIRRDDISFGCCFLIFIILGFCFYVFFWQNHKGNLMRAPDCCILQTSLHIFMITGAVIYNDCRQAPECNIAWELAAPQLIKITHIIRNRTCGRRHLSLGAGRVFRQAIS